MAKKQFYKLTIEVIVKSADIKATVEKDITASLEMMKTNDEILLFRFNGIPKQIDLFESIGAHMPLTRD